MFSSPDAASQQIKPWTVFEHFSAQLSSWVWFPPRLLRPKLEICYGFVQLARARRYHCLWLVSGLLPLSFISTAFSCNCKMLEEVLGLCTMYFDETVVFLKRKKISFFCFMCLLFPSKSWNLAVACGEFAAVTLFFDAACGASGFGLRWNRGCRWVDGEGKHWLIQC